MSKYIDAERLNMEWQTLKPFGVTDTMIENLKWIVDRQPTIEVSEENELKFYYVESIDDYWIGQRLDNFYYAEWVDRIGFVWTHSRYLPWGEHVVDEQTLWKEHTYPSEPREIPFTEWIVGFMKKYGSKASEDCISREWVRKNMLKYGFLAPDMTVTEFVTDAPSAVPTTEQSSKVGEWISQEQGAFYPVECSNCHKQPLFNEDEEYEYTKYCPYCGVKMGSGETLREICRDFIGIVEETRIDE